MPDDITSGEIASAAKAASAAASPAPHPQSSDPASASTRTTPEATEPTTEDRYKGWIPPDAHERVVSGFHKRLDDVSWAVGLSREDVEDALAARRRSAQPAAGQEPQPDVLDEHQQPFYSPQQAAKWAAWKAEQIVDARMKAIDARIAPIEDARARDAQTSALQQQLHTASAWPGFMDHVDVVTQAIRAANAAGRPLSLYDAYIQHVVPKLSDLTEAKKKWLAELNDTTVKTSNDTNPSRTPASSRKADEDMSLGELIQDEVAKRKAS